MEITLPFNGTTITVREMTGVEEDILLDEKKLRDGRAINHILANCSGLEYNTVISMVQADRVALMIGIRRETFGDEVSSTVRCSSDSCRQKIAVTGLTLSNLQLYPTTREQYGDHGEYVVELSNGHKCAFRMLTGHDEKTFIGLKTDEAMMTMILLIPLLWVLKPDGTRVEDNDKKKWLRNLGLKYRAEMRKKMEENYFGYDTRFTVECPKCGMEIIGTMEGLEGFFSL